MISISTYCIINLRKQPRLESIVLTTRHPFSDWMPIYPYFMTRELVGPVAHRVVASRCYLEENGIDVRVPLLFSSPPLVVLLSGPASLSASHLTVSVVLISSSATHVSRCRNNLCLMAGSRVTPGVSDSSDDSKNLLTYNKSDQFVCFTSQVNLLD